jgi:hypothetical protein
MVSPVSMTTVVHLLAIAFATIIAAALIYRLIRKYEPQLAKGVVIIFAVFGGLLTSVASIKTNSPPARAIGHVITLCTNAFNSLEQQTGYSFTEANANEIHNLAMPDNAQLAERIARRGAHQDGFHHFDSFTNRLARAGLDLENPVWIQTDGTITNLWESSLILLIIFFNTHSSVVGVVLMILHGSQKHP